MGFGIGELAPQRILSLILGGQQPFAIDPENPGTAAVGKALKEAQSEGIEAFVRALEEHGGTRFPEPQRTHYLENDVAAIYAAWQCGLKEADIVRHLRDWQIPCLVFVGARDADFYEQARRAAEQIPTAQFFALEEADHLGAHFSQNVVIEPMLKLFRSATD